MKGKQFDIQFTFNRLPVQMGHRACDRITRTEMRHVLFPQEGILHQRGEINKQVRSVLVPLMYIVWYVLAIKWPRSERVIFVYFKFQILL